MKIYMMSIYIKKFKLFFLIQVSEGYDYETSSEIFKEYECVICQHLIREAMMLPCHHSFCKQCLQKWEKQKDR